MTDDKPSGQKGQPVDQMKTYARYSAMAFQMLFIILVGVVSGYWIDTQTGWKFPVFTVLLSLSSVGLAIYYATKDLLGKKRKL
ncbi:MAG TPA: AtpZ/AtpI family protein [Bacteroidales bacterium]|nr:AtpZ/AtpI family protein [Bacteroidales bacterium]